MLQVFFSALILVAVVIGCGADMESVPQRREIVMGPSGAESEDSGDIPAVDSVTRPQPERFGEAIAYSGLTCAFWPVHPDADPVPTVARGAAPIVVVGTTGDPATPYAWAEKLASTLESGILLTYEGEGHTAYGGKSACIDDAIDRYLIDLEPPPAGTRCS